MVSQLPVGSRFQGNDKPYASKSQIVPMDQDGSGGAPVGCCVQSPKKKWLNEPWFMVDITISS